MDPEVYWDKLYMLFFILEICVIGNYSLFSGDQSELTKQTIETTAAKNNS